MAEVLVDTDVLVDHLRTGEGLLDGWGGDAAYSVITRAELFAGRGADEAGVQLLLGPMRELPVDGTVAESAGRIRREAGIALADALVAATAVTHGLPLLTRNRRHLEKVSRLRLAETR